MTDESSDDDCPESVSFSKSKENAISSIDAIKASRKQDKAVKKRLNAEREQRNTEQKKMKTLPLEVLQQAEQMYERKKKIEASFEKLETKSESTHDSDIQSSDEDEVKYVPVSKTKKFVKPYNEVMDFKSNHLFNGRIRRLNTQQQKNLSHKLSSRERRR